MRVLLTLPALMSSKNRFKQTESRYMLSLKKTFLKLSHQLNSENNGPIMLFKNIWLELPDDICLTSSS